MIIGEFKWRIVVGLLGVVLRAGLAAAVGALVSLGVLSEECGGQILRPFGSSSSPPPSIQRPDPN